MTDYKNGRIVIYLDSDASLYKAITSEWDFSVMIQYHKSITTE